MKNDPNNRGESNLRCEGTERRPTVAAFSNVWLARFVVLSVLLLPASASSLDDIRRQQNAVAALPGEIVYSWQYEEQSLSATVAEIRLRHVQFNRNLPYFSQVLVDDARARMVHHIGRGVAPSRALRMAVADIEREGMPLLVLTE